ncbi:MAG: L,D-transpeptidase [Hyphomicrobiales bacterium]|nr:L,D-transpeptidase [Hyphomicrobiales bacterium]
MLSRRTVVFGLPLLTAGCASAPPIQMAAAPVDPAYQAMYGEIDSERFPVPAIDLTDIDPVFLRQEVSYSTAEQPGTVVIDPANHFLYLVRAGGRAMRYGIGVGREGFGWSGRAQIDRKAEWPTWTPPHEMVLRDPKAAPFAKGMPGGPKNPLGARAMYLYQDGRDTLYRIHGTTEPESIGQSMSSGCIRLMNQDIINLYGRVPTGSRVVVLRATGMKTS